MICSGNFWSENERQFLKRNLGPVKAELGISSPVAGETQQLRCLVCNSSYSWSRSLPQPPLTPNPPTIGVDSITNAEPNTELNERTECAKNSAVSLLSLTRYPPAPPGLSTLLFLERSPPLSARHLAGPFGSAALLSDIYLVLLQISWYLFHGTLSVRYSWVITLERMEEALPSLHLIN